MRAEVGLVSEGFGADGTLEGLFAYRKIKLHITFFLNSNELLTSVCSDVSLKQPWSRKSFSAMRTLATLIVSSDVH